MRPGMKDVARHAGVSAATVSHVINNTRFVAEETRQKVMDSINALGYVPDPTARSFKTGRKNLVGIIVPDISNPVWSIIIEEVEGILAKDGYKLIIVNTKETQQREIENIRVLSNGITDGLIIATTLEDFSQIRQSVPPDYPLVLIDRILDGCTCDTVIPQDYPAMYDGISQMIMNGHRRIGIITGLMRLSTSHNRLSAYRTALTDFGIPIDRDLIQYGNSLSQSAVPLVRNLLEKECSAIVVSNNVMLDDVLYYLNTQGLNPGTDIALLGQTVEGRKNYFTNQISLIMQPSGEIGRMAGRQILDRIGQPDLPLKNTILRSVLLQGIQE